MDDEPVNQAVLKVLLHGEQYEVVALVSAPLTPVGQRARGCGPLVVTRLWKASAGRCGRANCDGAGDRTGRSLPSAAAHAERQLPTPLHLLKWHPNKWPQATAEELLEHLQDDRHVPDVVLLDVALGPGMSGYDACRALRQRWKPAELPVVVSDSSRHVALSRGSRSASDVLSGHGLFPSPPACRARRLAPPHAQMLTCSNGEEAVIKGLEAGASDYMAKPLRAAELKARIQTQVRGRERPRRLLREAWQTKSRSDRWRRAWCACPRAGAGGAQAQRAGRV